MTTGATGQLGLALPVQGELSGTWGDTVNNGITQYTNIAIAGTLTLTGDGAVTLTNTTGDATASNITSSLTGAGTVTAQFAIVKISGTLTTTKVVTFGSAGSAPYSKTFMVVNAATGGTVTFKAYGQTGVSIAVGESAWVYYNGTDIVKIAGTASGAAAGSTTQVQYNNAGALAGSSSFVFDGSAIGLGATPSAWSASYKALQSGNGSSFVGFNGNDQTFVVSNAYNDGSWKYRNTAGAGYYAIQGVSSGVHAWFTAPSGTAGNAITFTQAMTLDASSNLALGTTTQKVTQFGGSATGMTIGSATYPVLALWDTADASYNFMLAQDGGTAYVFNNANGPLTFSTNATERARIDSSGNVLVGGTAARGTTAGTAHLDLFNGTAPAGTLTNGVSLYSSSGDLKFMNAAGDGFDVGYRNIPQNSQSAAYTTVLADAGKCIYHPTTDANARTFTIAANSSVAYPIGTVIQFVNMTSQVVTIAINTDTMYLAGTGTTGSRSLAIYGVANAMKMTSTTWIITGSGLT